ncbi:MAG: Sua5/YciO/YrdC/YwlC family protein [Patulibacter sp.]|nr:Sua5/YciO/YrdC/YwlC family protein [Patulibacter sp.]
MPESVDRLPLDADQVAALTAVTSRGGLVIFPAETVYGIATDPDDGEAVRRMAALKQRDPAKPSSVLFWSVDDALAVLEGAPESVLRAVSRLLPGPVGLIVPNPKRRFAPACGDDPSSLGIRVPLLGGGVGDGPEGQRLSASPIVQTSANLANGPDPTTLAAVPAAVRAGADLVLDAGERPGVPSTIVDLRGITDATPDGWRIVREGPVTVAAVAAALVTD